MSMPSDPAGPVHSFLKGIRPHVEKLPDPFGNEITSAGREGLPAPVRVRGLLAQLAEQDREIARRFACERGALTQQFISRGLSNSTAYYSNLSGLYRTEEADRSSSREQWYCGLGLPDRAACDNHCLAIAETCLLPLFPQDFPACLRAPLARLALEYAALVRRYIARQSEMVMSLANSGLGNRTVVVSLIRGMENAEEEARSRLEGRWFRELAPEQQSAFDGPGQKPVAAPEPSGTAGAEAGGHPPADEFTGLLSAPAIAKMFRVSLPALESALRRERETHTDCFVETDEGRRVNEPKYLYRVAEIRPIIERLQGRR
jgi:hypothetical protein